MEVNNLLWIVTLSSAEIAINLKCLWLRYSKSQRVPQLHALMGLAGRKQKQRIPADPRNLSWADGELHNP